MNKEKLMQRCIELGKKSLGLTYPNPNVGALIFYDGKIIGEGYTSKIGGNHAEINAINSVREKTCLLYTSPSPRDLSTSRMPSSA